MYENHPKGYLDWSKATQNEPKRLKRRPKLTQNDLKWPDETQKETIFFYLAGVNFRR